MGIIIRTNSGEVKSFLKIEDGLAYEAKLWRDDELVKTDYIVPTTDHPQHAEYMDYRVALRNWPSTDDFPGTRPTL